MRLFFFVALLVAGCFKPDVQNRGFTCQVGDSPACPEGFYCVSGFCQTMPGGGGDLPDLAMPVDQAMTMNDASGKPDGMSPPKDFAAGGGDLSSSPDLSSTPDLASPPDLTPPPDLVSPPDMCGVYNDPCVRNRDCCSGSCDTFFGLCN